MTQNRFLILVVLMLSGLYLLTGCLVTRQEVRDSVKNETLTPEQQKNTDNDVRYQEMDELVRGMNGRLETLENSIHILNADKTGSGIEQQNEKKTLQEKLKIYEEAINKLEADNVALQKRVDELAAAQAAGASNKDTSVVGAPTKGAFDSAEASFGKKKWKEAIVSFEKYRTSYPSGKRYAEATYKMAMSFQEMGMKTEAKAFYSEVTEKFAKSDWAKKAQKNLRSLK